MSSPAVMRTTVDASLLPRSRGKRDYRLDFFRGIALLFIFIDHIPDNVVSYFTLRSFAFCDAAEVFIFISGYTAALAYAPVFDREGVAMGIARIYRRVWQLYVAHLCLFMIFNAEVAYTMRFFKNPLFADELQVGDYLDNPGEAFIRVLLLQFQPSLLNILPLYIALLLVLPFFILCIRRNILLGLVPAAVLYGIANLFSWNLPGFPEGRLWFFNPLAWQFLFAIAATLGFARTKGWTLVPTHGSLRWVALGFAVVAGVISLSWTLHETLPKFPPLTVLPNLWFDKTMLPPARLLSILALAVLADHYVSRDAAFITSRAGWITVLCGQNSLQVFCLSILMSVLVNFALNLVGYGILPQMIATVAGVLFLLLMGIGLAWFNGGGQVPGPPIMREPS